jgi:hypothetical protein
MDSKTKNEIKNLMKIGLPEDLAMLAAGIKHGNEDVVNEVLYEKQDEQEELAEAIKHLKPFSPLALQDDPTKIITPVENVFVEVNPITGEMKPYVSECPAPFVVEEESTIKVIYEGLVETGIVCDSCGA